jgi:hypothetical protein
LAELTGDFNASHAVHFHVDFSSCISIQITGHIFERLKFYTKQEMSSDFWPKTDNRGVWLRNGQRDDSPWDAMNPPDDLSVNRNNKINSNFV